MRVAMLLFLAVLAAVAAQVAWTSPHRYSTQDRDNVSVAPNKSYRLGTDELGRDQAVRLAVALLLSFGAASLAAVLAGCLSVGAGISAAFGPTWLRSSMLYLGDLFLTLPWLFFLMLVRSALPLNCTPLLAGTMTYLLLAILGVPAFLRINERKSSSLAKSGWYLQAQAAGLRPSQLFRQLLPHLRRLFWTQLLLFVPVCISAEANLGTLGLGLPQPLPSLGTFLARLQSDVLFSTSPLAYLPVTVLICALVATEFAVFGDSQ